jgi:ABC-2 type transport system permease protein
VNLKRTLATTERVLRQVRHDRTTIAMILVIPCLLLGLIAWLFQDNPRVIDSFAPMLVGVFPAVVMFLITSVATMRERSSGTLERLMTTPISKADFMFGYAIAFGLMAWVQTLVFTGFAVYVCGMAMPAVPAAFVVVAIADAVLGTCLGLMASALAKTEFQAVQMMPIFLAPQIVLCGIIVPRDTMPRVLELISDVLPFSYAIDAMRDITIGGGFAEVGPELAIICAFILVALVGGVLTLRRRSP